MKTRPISNNAARFVKALDLSNISGAELARKLGIENEQNITNWKSRGVPANKLSAVSLVLGLRREWLEFGELPMFSDEAEIVFSQESDPKSYALTSINHQENETLIDENGLEYRFYREIEISPGCGRTVVREIQGPKLQLPLASMRECGVAPRHVVFATSSGNSNHPLIPHGAVVAIDKEMTKIVDGELYAIDHDGLLRMKFLQRLPAGAIKLRSFNSTDYLDEEYALTEILEQRLVILGRVFWWAVSKPLRSTPQK